MKTDCCDICMLNHSTGEHYSIAPVKVKGFRKAELTDIEKADINQLWHLSRVESHQHHSRMSYVFKWFRRRHDNPCSDKALWLAIETETSLVKAV